TSSAPLPARACRTRRSLAPPRRHRVLEPELVEATGHYEINEIVYGQEAVACDAAERTCRLCRYIRLNAVVEAGREEEHRRPSLSDAEHVLEVDRRERRLARAEDELAFLLQRHARRALDQVRHRARGDRAERA